MKMKTVKADELCAALERLGIPTQKVFRIEIDLDRILVFRYKTNEKGQAFVIPGTDTPAEEVETIPIIPCRKLSSEAVT
jgi:hypothetical protein